MKSQFLDRNFRFFLLAFVVATQALLCRPSDSNAQTDTLNGAISIAGQESVSGQVTQFTFAPGDNSTAYVATFGGGVQAFDYDPSNANFFTNGRIAVPASIVDSNNQNGSLGIAFHDDPSRVPNRLSTPVVVWV